MVRSRGFLTQSGPPVRLTIIGKIHLYHTDQQWELLRPYKESIARAINESYVDTKRKTITFEDLVICFSKMHPFQIQIHRVENKKV